MKTDDDRLKDFLIDLRNARNQKEEASLGNRELPALIRRSPAALEAILKLARRDNRMRRALSAARYYTGLSEDVCAMIDAVLHSPFPGASGPRSHRRR
jgi:hypothetical protein